MPGIRFSVVIPTYNRSQLLGRALRSALDQAWPELEVVVVDDASSDGTPDLVQRSFASVRYCRQESNRGECAARNRGLHEAARPWVVFLDDDDTLLPGALARMAARLAELPDPSPYPVCQFTHSNGEIPGDFLLVRPEHYVRGTLRGDFIPVISRERFLAEGLAYPEARSPEERIRGGEDLLWWRVAERFGIPTWAEQVGTVCSDGQNRYTSTDYQLRHARDVALLHERRLEERGPVAARDFPGYYERMHVTAAASWLLAGERARARAHLRQTRSSGVAWGLRMLSYLPHVFTRMLFVVYRRYITGWKS